MTLIPCNNCRLKQTCKFRAEKRQLLRGSGLTLARFTCRIQRDDLPPGAIVDARLKYVFQGRFAATDEPDSPDIPLTEEGILRGIVMRWAGQKVLVYFAPQDGGSLWSFTHGEQVQMAKLLPNCLTPTGERAVVCKHCGLPKSAAENDEASRWTCRSTYEGESLDCQYAETGVTP